MRRPRLRGILTALVAVGVLYFLLAYVLLPRLWYHREHEPGLAEKPSITTTPQGIPGDPLNVGMVGDKADVLKAMHMAGWYPADPITLKSSIEIAGSVVFDRPYDEAPVSTLFYEGRKQDFAFEKPIGDSADRRNHMRLWLVLDKGVNGRPVWLGSATLDAGVGLNHYNGQFTHHISPNVDAERDTVIRDLTNAGVVSEIFQVSGVGPTLNGRNGEDDWYYTDGEIKVAVLTPGAVKDDKPPTILDDPLIVQIKNGLWASANQVLGTSP